MRFQRTAGILLHPTSLPGRYGVGDLGDAAFAFVDFLYKSRQSLWQTLPLGPTGYGDSPYQCFSAFAGNPLLISPDKLVEAGYLPKTAVSQIPTFPTHKVDYGAVIEYKNSLFQTAYTHFQTNGTAEQKSAFTQFCADNQDWLEDYATFVAIKNKHIDKEGGVWNTWALAIAQRKPTALAKWQKQLAEDIERHKFLQFLFFQQWLAVKTYANERGIRIIGDIPIFVAFDSADVWAHPELFYLNKKGQPTVIAGVPPDYFSETGQRWGNPLYRWDKMAEDGYEWWAKRLKSTFTIADIARIDHFRGFEAYWEIPASEPTAVVGQWVKGPHKAFFAAMENKLGKLPIIAEDLGVITPEVQDLRDSFGFPGMKILQFAFGGEQNSDFLPHSFTANSVVYTGTHDNETTVGWYLNASEAERDHVRRYLGVSGRDIAWDMIRLALMSVSDMAVVPMQDLFSLDNTARMNYPGKASGWWQWRYTNSMLNDTIAHRLAQLSHLYGRIPAPTSDDVT